MFDPQTIFVLTVDGGIYGIYVNIVFFFEQANNSGSLHVQLHVAVIVEPVKSLRETLVYFSIKNPSANTFNWKDKKINPNFFDKSNDISYVRIHQAA